MVEVRAIGGQCECDVETEVGKSMMISGMKKDAALWRNAKRKQAPICLPRRKEDRLAPEGANGLLIKMVFVGMGNKIIVDVERLRLNGNG